MAILEKFEFAKLDACRFVGKRVYAPPGSGVIFGKLWGESGEVFETIKALDNFSTDETNDIALLTFDTYEQDKLMGYTVGRFMKADCPVPDGLDFIDISSTVVAKGWVRGEFNDMINTAESLISESIKKEPKYTITWAFAAEVYSCETNPNDGVESVMGYYIACKETL